MTDFWTSERVETLKKLWAQGYSASSVAKQMGAPSRNSVLSKIHRIGLSGSREKPIAEKTDLIRVKATPRGQTHRRKTPELVSPPLDVPRETAVAMLNVFPVVHGLPDALVKLDRKQCKWPIGETSDSDFHFCTNEREGEAYCVGHERAAAGHTPASRHERMSNHHG